MFINRFDIRSQVVGFGGSDESNVLAIGGSFKSALVAQWLELW